MKKRHKVNVACSDCKKTWLKRKTSIKYWNGRCKSCENKSRTTSMETREKQSSVRTKLWEDSSYKQMMSEAQKGKFGCLSNSWQGGKASLSQAIRHLDEYTEWRSVIFHRDTYTCQCCKVKGGYLHAHHKQQFHKILDNFLRKYNQFSIIDDRHILLRLAITYELFWDIDNGKTLCKKCHTLEHSISKGV